MTAVAQSGTGTWRREKGDARRGDAWAPKIGDARTWDRGRNFPFLKRSSPFLRHLENFWTIIESFSTKKKDIHNPDSNPGPFVC